MVTELNALKQAVAALTTKTDGLQTDVTNIKTDVGTIETTVEQIAGQGGNGYGYPVDITKPDDVWFSKNISITSDNKYYLATPGMFSSNPCSIYIRASNGYLYINDKKVDLDGDSPMPLGVLIKMRTTGNATIRNENGLVMVYNVT